jgi:hypothetical protein
MKCTPRFMTDAKRIRNFDERSPLGGERVVDPGVVLRVVVLRL